MFLEKLSDAFIKPKLVYGMIAAVALAMIVSIIMVTRIGLNLSEQHVPLADAAQEIKTHTTEFHLWFEELLQGDPTINADEVWSHYHHAEWFANVMLHGGEDVEGLYIPLDHTLLKEHISQVLVSLQSLKAIAIQRLEQSKTSTIGSETDQAFDASYAKVMAEAQEAETTLHKAVDEEIRTIIFMVSLLIMTLMILAIGAAFMFHKMNIDIKQTKEKQLENERHYRTFIETAMDGFWLTDKQSNLLEVNDAYCKMSGYSREELLSMTVADLDASETTDEVITHIERIVADGKAKFETKHRRKDGELIDVEISATIVLFNGVTTGVVFIHDLTKRKKDDQALAEREERLALAMDGSNDGLWDWNLKTNTVVYSKRWKSMLGYTEDELENVFETWERLVHPEDIEQAKQHIDDYLTGKTHRYEFEFRMQHKDGHWVNILARGNGVRGKESDAYERLVGTHVDISERKQMEAKLESLASKDGLTNLSNRMHFNDMLNNEIGRANRYKTPLALLMLDLDHFKNINDTYGHQAGDACLVAFANLLRGLTRSADICARYGGEEFVILLPETLLENAVVFAERLRRKVEEMVVQYDHQSIQLTVSIGVTALNLEVENSDEDLLKVADSFLYKAKEKGRNCVVSI